VYKRSQSAYLFSTDPNRNQMQRIKKILSAFLPDSIPHDPRLDEPQTDIITYRMGRDMVYLPLARTYIEALKLASNVFPRLSGIDNACICFTLTVNLRGQSFPVRISPMSWPDIRMQVVQYEILDVHVAQSILWKDVKELEPPSYALNSETAASNSSGRRSSRFIEVLQALKWKYMQK